METVQRPRQAGEVCVVPMPSTDAPLTPAPPGVHWPRDPPHPAVYGALWRFNFKV